MAKIRVLVVEDSLTVRKYLVEVLEADPEHRGGRRGRGRQAGHRAVRDAAPRRRLAGHDAAGDDGLAATEYIMAYCPTPILIVSASLNRGEVFKTYDALRPGRWTCSRKPGSDRLRPRTGRRLIARRQDGLAHQGHHASPGSPRPAAPATARPRWRRCRRPPSRFRAWPWAPPPAARGSGRNCCAACRATFPLPILLVIHIGTAVRHCR